MRLKAISGSTRRRVRQVSGRSQYPNEKIIRMAKQGSVLPGFSCLLRRESAVIFLHHLPFVNGSGLLQECYLFATSGLPSTWAEHSLESRKSPWWNLVGAWSKKLSTGMGMEAAKDFCSAILPIVVEAVWHVWHKNRWHTWIASARSRRRKVRLATTEAFLF